MLFGGARSATAQTACPMVDSLLETVSILQDIQSTSDTQHYRQQMEKLETRSAQISLAELIPPDSVEAFPKESAALFHYMSSLRDAVESARIGYDNYSRQKLSEAQTPDFSRSLESLEYYWGCRTNEDEGESVTSAPTQDAETFYSAAAQTDVTPIQGAQPKPATGKPNAGEAVSSSGTLYGPKAARSAVLTYRAPIFIVIFGLLLSGGLYYLRQRAKRFTSREVRRYLYMPVKIGVNEQHHTATLVNISLNGTKLKHEGALVEQKKLRLELDGSWYVGDIMWSNESFAGVRFKKPIPHTTFNALVKSAANDPTATVDKDLPQTA